MCWCQKVLILRNVDGRYHKEDCYKVYKKDGALEHKNFLECYPEWRMCYDHGLIIDDAYRIDDRDEMC